MTCPMEADMLTRFVNVGRDVNFSDSNEPEQ